MRQTHKGITGDNWSRRSPLYTLHIRNLSQSKLFQKKKEEKGYASALLETAPTLSLSLSLSTKVELPPKLHEPAIPGDAKLCERAREMPISLRRGKRRKIGNAACVSFVSWLA
jgi:hypothetical protein